MTLFRSWRQNRRGNVAVMFALSAAPLVTALGAAVDYSRAASIRTELQADTDAAALLACKSALTADSDLKNLVQTALNGYLPAYTTTIENWVSANNPRTIEFATKVVYPTRFMQIVNIRTVDLKASTKCALGETSFEIALVVDTTGSMNRAADSQKTKIEALRASAKSFVTTMFTTTPSGRLKMSLVPFAAMVKVKPSVYAPGGTSPATWLDTGASSAYHWQNFTRRSYANFTLNSRFDIYTRLKNSYSGWSWQGCLEAQPASYSVTDDAVTSGDSMYVPSLAPDEIGTKNDNNSNRDITSVNDYLDDGNSDEGNCDNDTSSSSRRLGQVCKYKTAYNKRTSQPGPDFGCTSDPLITLTNTSATLTDAIDALAASGSTNIHQGLHWGWRTVSPNGVFAGPAAYTNQKTKKIIVLMTDGMNEWQTNNDLDNAGYTTSPYVQSYYSAYGYLRNADGTGPTSTPTRFDSATSYPSGSSTPSNNADTRAAIDALTAKTCDNARAKGVEIYTVAFSVSGDTMDTAGQQMLLTCTGRTAASNVGDSKRAYLATDSASLNAAFVAIAKGIGALRITR